MPDNIRISLQNLIASGVILVTVVGAYYVNSSNGKSNALAIEINGQDIVLLKADTKELRHGAHKAELERQEARIRQENTLNALGEIRDFIKTIQEVEEIRHATH